MNIVGLPDKAVSEAKERVRAALTAMGLALPARRITVNLSPADLAKVKQRAAGGCEVLGLRYTGDMAVGTRFETLTREIGDAFIRVEFPGRKHSTLTAHRQQEGVDRVLAFFREKLLVG